MKRSEAYINLLSKKFFVSPATAKVIYEAVDTYAREVFCSYMSDAGDRPDERVAAAKKFDKFKNLYSAEFQKTIMAIFKFMDKDPDYNIHKMDEEIMEEETK